MNRRKVDEMKNNTTYEMQPWMMWQKHNDTFYLCDLRDESLFFMTDISYEIINSIFLDENEVEEVIEKLASKYKVEKDTIRTDVNEFLVDLVNIDLIKEVECYEGD